MKNSVAIFGGSFDPPHLGHLEIIQKLDSMGVYDKIIIIPTFCNPFKAQSSFPPAKRFAWLQKICKPFPKVEVSDFEIVANRVVYAIEYIQAYKKLYPHITLVLGADNLESLPQWKDFESIKQMVEFLVVIRFGIKNPTAYPSITIKNDTIASSIIRKDLSLGKIPNGLIPSIKDEIINTYTHKESF